MGRGKTVFLLGAGAMKPWGGPLAKDIDDYLVSLEEYLTTHKKPKPAIKHLYDKLNVNNQRNAVNFETIIAAVESIFQYFNSDRELFFYNKGHYSNALFNPKSLVDRITNITKHDEVSENNESWLFVTKNQDINTPDQILKGAEKDWYFRHFLSYLLYAVRDKILEYDNPLRISEKSHLNKKLFRFLTTNKASGVNRIYTINYDRIIPYIFRQEKMPVFDGFSDSLSTDYEMALYPDTKRVYTDFQCLNYYNLHGSIYWDYKFDIKTGEYIYVCSPNKPHLLGSYAQYELNPGRSLMYSNIVTGYNKVNRISFAPLNGFYHAFQNDCLAADVIKIIGYSFGDAHINNVFRTVRRTKGNDVKFEVITYLSDYDLLHGFFNNRRSEGSELQKKVFTTSEMTYKTQKPENGWLHFNKCNCSIYFDGFKNFLSNNK